MQPHIIASELQEIMKTSSAAYHDLMEAKAEYEKLDEMKKMTINVIKNSYKEDITESERERRAYQNQRYVDFLKLLDAARLTYYKHLAVVKSLEMNLSAIQSMNKLLITEKNLDQFNT